jgi:hypothetical protein
VGRLPPWQGREDSARRSLSLTLVLVGVGLWQRRSNSDPRTTHRRQWLPGADVFVSYSRRDREFAERVHSGLAERGKDVYTDWEDIPSWSPDYEAELFAAIDASDSCLFILTDELQLGAGNRAVLRQHALSSAARTCRNAPSWSDAMTLEFRVDAGRLGTLASAERTVWFSQISFGRPEATC